MTFSPDICAASDKSLHHNILQTHTVLITCKNMRKLCVRWHGPVYVRWVGCGKAPGGPYQPLRPSRCSLEAVGGERVVPLLFSVIYDCSLWHASDRYHCGKDRNKAQGGRASVCVCVCARSTKQPLPLTHRQLLQGCRC